MVFALRSRSTGTTAAANTQTKRAALKMVRTGNVRRQQQRQQQRQANVDELALSQSVGAEESKTFERQIAALLPTKCGEI
jgi:hypothetical protein